MQHDDETETVEDDLLDDSDASNSIREGSIASARFNILNTMVGGGCLSLPLAFQQAGNALMGPLLLILTGLITDFCFRLLVASLVHLKTPHPVRRGNQTFESLTVAAFGPKADMLGVGLGAYQEKYDRTAVVGRCMISRVAGIQPVSYTHLTLPTKA